MWEISPARALAANVERRDFVISRRGIRITFTVNVPWRDPGMSSDQLRKAEEKVAHVALQLMKEIATQGSLPLRHRDAGSTEQA
jgi:hypothetical protein